MDGFLEINGTYKDNLYVSREIPPQDAQISADNRFLSREKDTASLRLAKPFARQRIKPFLKWAGGKSKLIDEIRAHYPHDLGNTTFKYAEPFVGGGAVLFDVLDNYPVKEVYISDTNDELINVYLALRDDVDDLIDLLERLRTAFLGFDINDRKQYYYEKRSRFNELKAVGQSGTESAALFIFLNRTCFNGLYRVNKEGKFNVPMGDYKNPTICDTDNLRRVSRALNNVNIVCADYKISASFIDEQTFAYFDPPYRPLSASSKFTAYTAQNFDDADQTELAAFIKRLAQKGAHIVASNSDPKNTDASDNFFDDLYRGLNIKRIYAARMINSNAAARGKISELLIYNGER